MKALIAIWAILAVVTVCESRVITVDDDAAADFSTIQAAIDDSNDGDTVLVADGTYTGNGNRDIDFHGKAITVKSENGPENCIIDCDGTPSEPHRGFYFHRFERQDSVLSGLTVRNGYADAGGGIYCSFSSPTITNCIIIANNAADYGGGLYCIDSSPVIENCRFVGNRASSMYGGAVRSVREAGLLRNCVISGNTAAISGGGIALYNDTMRIENCIIIGNTAERDYGGGVYLSECWVQVNNCTVVGNSAAREGGGVRVTAAVAAMTNCIIRDNTAPIDPEVSSGSSYNTVTISYSNVEGGYAGTGNIDSDPCFADPCNGDYHLKSQAGRWDANEERWTIDEVTSLCIDGGAPMTPIGAEPFSNGGIINMGAYGGTTEASKSHFGVAPCETIVAGDVNGDCKIDFLDFRIIALHWLGDAEVTNSNYRVEAGIEYSLQTDEFVYHVGQRVAMLYRVTNLGGADVGFTFWNSPEWNFWVKKDGESIWTAVEGWWTMPTRFTLRPGQRKQYLYVWNMKDNDGILVGQGEYTAIAGFDAGTDGYGDYDFSKVSVTIEIEP